MVSMDIIVIGFVIFFIFFKFMVVIMVTCRLRLRRTVASGCSRRRWRRTGGWRRRS